MILSYILLGKLETIDSIFKTLKEAPSLINFLEGSFTFIIIGIIAFLIYKLTLKWWEYLSEKRKVNNCKICKDKNEAVLESNVNAIKDNSKIIGMYLKTMEQQTRILENISNKLD